MKVKTVTKNGKLKDVDEITVRQFQYKKRLQSNEDVSSLF